LKASVSDTAAKTVVVPSILGAVVTTGEPDVELALVGVKLPLGAVVGLDSPLQVARTSAKIMKSAVSVT
jgi:hypothetical protein